MLRTVSIRNLALIESAEIDFHSGFTVWTGETGSGKSLLLSAISLVLGSRADTTSVRTGCKEALVACRFDISRPDLREKLEHLHGAENIEEDIVLMRRISLESNRSNAYINGLPVTLKMLRETGRLLFHYVGQSESRSLCENSEQTRILDSFGKVNGLIGDYLKARAVYESMRMDRIKELSQTEGIQREIQLLEFEISELDALAPQKNEPESLRLEAIRLSKAEEIQKLCGHGAQHLYHDDNSVHDSIARVLRRIQKLPEFVPKSSETMELLEQSMQIVADAAMSLHDICEAIDSDSARLEAVESRLSEYRRFSKRFHVEETHLEEILDHHRQRLDLLIHSRTGLTDFQSLQEQWLCCQTLANQIFHQRTKAIRLITELLPKVLTKLSLPQVGIEIQISQTTWEFQHASLPSCPLDPAPVKFLFRPNPGELAQPLEKIASGGELSRLLLAFFVCLSESDRTPTIVFDEIDTGVGGRLGMAIGELLLELASHHQVICITHLPQIAAFANQHFLVHKSGKANRTYSEIQILDTEKKRIHELAAMLRGNETEDTTLKEARAILEQARSRTACSKSAKRTNQKPLRTRNRKATS